MKENEDELQRVMCPQDDSHYFTIFTSEVL